MCVLTVLTSARDAQAVTAASAAGAIAVCHVPPGDPAAAHTINVGSVRALMAHLAHGDSQGECVVGPPETPCEDACSADHQACVDGAAGDGDLIRVCDQDLADCLAACAS